MTAKPAALVLALAALSLLAGVLAGCGPQAPAGPASKLTEAEAAAMLDSALQALNTGDYAAWTRDWSDDMKAAIKEADFLAYRDEVLAAYGAYEGMASLELLPGANGPQFVRWSAVADFEQGQIRFNFGFQRDGNQIVGLRPEAVE
jgi:hypothetical protein